MISLCETRSSSVFGRYFSILVKNSQISLLMKRSDSSKQKALTSECHHCCCLLLNYLTEPLWYFLVVFEIVITDYPSKPAFFGEKIHFCQQQKWRHSQSTYGKNFLKWNRKLKLHQFIKNYFCTWKVLKNLGKISIELHQFYWGEGDMYMRGKAGTVIINSMYRV